MKKALLLMLVLIFIAGCIGQRQVKIEANNGLKITEFSADPRVAEFNDNVLFTVGIENVGGTTASGTEIRLFGIENIWLKPAGALADSEAVTRTFGENLDPPLPQQNRPGDLKIFTRTFRPPVLPEGVEQDFPVRARLAFDYSTTGSIVVPTISKSLLKIKRDKGEVIDDAARIANSDGPLKIGLSKGTVPIVVDDTRGHFQEATFVIEIVNVGDGFPVVLEGDPQRARKVGLLEGSITVLGPGVGFDTKDGCLGIKPVSPTQIVFRVDAAGKVVGTGGEVIGGKVTEAEGFDLLKLRSNGRLPLSCTIRIDRGQFTPTTSGAISFSIKMDYRYFIEKTTNVRVVGTSAAELPSAVAPPPPAAGPPITLTASNRNPAVGESVTLEATAANVPNGYLIAIYRDGALLNSCGNPPCRARDESDTATTRTYKAKVEGYREPVVGNVLATSTPITVTWVSPTPTPTPTPTPDGTESD